MSASPPWLLLIGAALLAAGLVCNLWLPINKKLWTSSFALFMAGLDFVLFAGFAWVVDVRLASGPSGRSSSWG